MSAYRANPTFACLRCGETLGGGDDPPARTSSPIPTLANQGAHTCPRGCGEWMPRGVLEKLHADADVGTTQPAWQQRTAQVPCRVCGEQMEARKWGGAGFESCKDHGIWVDAAARREIQALLAVHVEQERRIGELMRELAEPGGPRALAIRLLALERRIDKLVGELGALEARVAITERR
ncbi:MAG: hypothetical protein KF773_29790 [Deltaproteobacteria bacterium]|nr:hypothetical protein [Deltaproteobacteria bacterium]MCW5803787.1 hypothetical protein [Deltaproteobacteria bacterium]